MLGIQGRRGELNDRVRMASDYTNIGNALRRMGKLQEALASHTKA
jgi:hypothetical protein